MLMTVNGKASKEFKRGFAPLKKTIPPLSFEGEGDTGGEVEKACQQSAIIMKSSE
jgi:hypothetical protein